MKDARRRRTFLNLALTGALATSLLTGCETRSAANDVIAIDVLLLPDSAMGSKARADNARLRVNLPAGYQLDATHVPHVTLIQRYVRARDMDSVDAAVSRALTGERPTEWPLRTTGYAYVMWGGHALTYINIEPTADLIRLQQAVVNAVAPYAVSGGTAAAFAGADPANPETVNNVEVFVPNGIGTKFSPHVTFGIANEGFVQQLKAEPFEAFTFRVAGVATYQLGNYGVASKLLWQAPAPAGR